MNNFIQNLIIYFALIINTCLFFAIIGEEKGRESILGRQTSEYKYETAFASGAGHESETHGGLRRGIASGIRRVQGVYSGRYDPLRHDNGGAAVDNISSGGLYALLDEEGRLSARAFCDKTGKFYEKHPEQNVSFAGYTVPFFHEAAELCRKSAERLPELGYIGWDAAITANGPVLIEGNHLPGYDMCQNVGLNHTDTGILPYFRQVLGESFFDA